MRAVKDHPSDRYRKAQMRTFHSACRHGCNASLASTTHSVTSMTPPRKRLTKSTLTKVSEILQVAIYSLHYFVAYEKQKALRIILLCSLQYFFTERSLSRNFLCTSRLACIIASHGRAEHAAVGVPALPGVLSISDRQFSTNLPKYRISDCKKNRKLT